MNIEEFRRKLVERQAESARVAIARLDGLDPDEARLDEIDGDLFSRARAREAAVDLEGARSSGDRSSRRAQLALTIERGMLARLRPIDRAIGRACADGRGEEAIELAQERWRKAGAEAESEWPAKEGLPSAIGAVRAIDLSRLAREARDLLDASAPLVERLLDADGLGIGSGGMGRRSHRAPGGRSNTVGVAPSTFSERVDRLLTERIGGEGMTIARGAATAAIADLSHGLGFGHSPPYRIEHRGRGELPALVADSPIVLEEDPPRSVRLIQRGPESGESSLASALAASAEALTAALRSATLPSEHRHWSDRSFALALGALFASLAPEHGAFRSFTDAAGRRALARAVLASRLSAAMTLALTSLLSGGAAGDGDDVVANAVLAPASFTAVPSSHEEVLDPLDRFRGGLLLAPILETLRTRFGNLWYREKGAGQWIRDAAEPGGSVTASEIAASLSLPEGSAAWLLELWQTEERRLR